MKRYFPGDKPRNPRSRLASGGGGGGAHSGGKGDLDSPTHIDPKEALDKLLRLLTRFHSTLTKHGLDPEIISQIFKQVEGSCSICIIGACLIKYLYSINSRSSISSARAA